GEAGLIFIDEESVLLPSADFAPSQAKDFLRIERASETPTGVYGSRWGSERIAGAARLAAAWGDRWKPLGLYRIVPVQLPGGSLIYELRTQVKARVLWGAAPGREAAGEPSPAQKIAALEQLVHDQGALDREGASSLIDLRDLAGPTKAATAPRPAS